MSVLLYARETWTLDEERRRLAGGISNEMLYGIIHHARSLHWQHKISILVISLDIKKNAVQLIMERKQK